MVDIKMIEEAWENRELLKDMSVQQSINEVIEQLDSGVLRVAEPEGDSWKVNDWVKKAVIMYFPIRKMENYHAMSNTR